MRFKIPVWYDRMMDRLAFVILPPPVPIYGRITALDLTLAIYTVILGAVLTWWFDSWWWFLATIVSMIFAAILDRFVFSG